jgi:hypothetical protein
MVLPSIEAINALLIPCPVPTPLDKLPSVLSPVKQSRSEERLEELGLVANRQLAESIISSLHLYRGVDAAYHCGNGRGFGVRESDRK